MWLTTECAWAAAEWTLFNEADMVAHFDPAAVVAWARQADPSRLLDTNSGGPANSLGVGDVNDTHDCPLPSQPAAFISAIANQLLD